jgi:hypothetical protein
MTWIGQRELESLQNTGGLKCSSYEGFSSELQMVLSGVLVRKVFRQRDNLL